MKIQIAFCGSGEYSGDYNELLYLRARFYAPGIGRFLTRDTWEGNANNPLSLNQWNYVQSNPINNIDPSGYWALNKNLELYPGGFYGLGRLKLIGGLCLHDEFCYSPHHIWIDMFILPPAGTGNDIQYKVSQFPDSMDPSKILQGDYYDVPSWIERIDGIKPIIGCIYPRRFPDSRLPIPFLNSNWKYATTLHGHSDAFSAGQAWLTAFASTNSPDQTHNDMNVTGVPLLDPRSGLTRPYTYYETGNAGNLAFAVSIGMNAWKALRDMAMREYWITIEENVSKPGLLRSQIITKRNDGSHYKLWFDVNGWHEDPFYDPLAGTR